MNSRTCPSASITGWPSSRRTAAPALRPPHPWRPRRLGPHPRALEGDVRAGEAGLLVDPQRLHRRDVLVDAGPARSPLDAVIGGFLDVPPVADAEVDAARSERVERRELLGGADRVALRGQVDAGPQPDARGPARGRGDRD